MWPIWEGAKRYKDMNREQEEHIIKHSCSRCASIHWPTVLTPVAPTRWSDKSRLGKMSLVLFGGVHLVYMFQAQFISGSQGRIPAEITEDALGSWKMLLTRGRCSWLIEGHSWLGCSQFWLLLRISHISLHLYCFYPSLPPTPIPFMPLPIPSQIQVSSSSIIVTYIHMCVYAHRTIWAYLVYGHTYMCSTPTTWMW